MWEHLREHELEYDGNRPFLSATDLAEIYVSVGASVMVEQKAGRNRSYWCEKAQDWLQSFYTSIVQRFERKL